MTKNISVCVANTCACTVLWTLRLEALMRNARENARNAREIARNERIKKSVPLWSTSSMCFSLFSLAQEHVQGLVSCRCRSSQVWHN